MGDLIVLTKERLADTETAVSAYLKLCLGRPNSFLLESAETHDHIGRFSVIAFDPLADIELWPQEVLVSLGEKREVFPAFDFFNTIRRTLAQLTLSSPVALPGVGSLVGYVGYDAVRLIEKLGPIPDQGRPVARLVFPARFLVFDHHRRVMILVSLGRTEADAQARLKDTEDMLNRGLPELDRPQGFSLVEPDRDHYMESVRKSKEYIKAGDIFQVVMADRYEGETDLSPFSLYRLLRIKSPSPYMFFLDFGRQKIIGASPETLVKVTGDRVLVRPIAGTRGRSSDRAKDLALEREMLESEKERAEHIMLVDLGRNDVGRVSEYGSVTVEPYMTVERYSHVMHIVSQVQGKLRKGADAVDAFMAGFPAGTVSGAPKVRAMEIIDELERVPRGPYSGAVGWFKPNNDMDTCIAIRMIHFEDRKFMVPVGAGIVADSIPELEFKEIQNKAAQSIAALKAAGGEL